MTAVLEREERCPLTDLLPSGCAHCRGIADPPGRKLTRWFRATSPAACIDCGYPIDPGDSYRVALPGGPICEDCGRHDHTY